MSRSRRPELLFASFLLVGVASVGLARMNPGETRTIPYRGVLERDGVAVTGTVTARFGLLDTPTGNASCVVTNTCAVWSEEQEIDVVDGQFSVILGDGAGPRPLDDELLAKPVLFLVVAVRVDGDAAFTRLDGMQEIVPVPWSARAAVASQVASGGVNAAAIRAGAVGSTAISPGAVTPAALAPTMFFSAQANFDGGNFYSLGNQTPANWLADDTGYGQSNDPTVQIFPNTALGVTKYKCSVTSLGAPRVYTIEEDGPSKIVVNTFNLAGQPAGGSFTLMCQGF